MANVGGGFLYRWGNVNHNPSWRASTWATVVLPEPETPVSTIIIVYMPELPFSCSLLGRAYFIMEMAPDLSVRKRRKLLS
jgi:hypothetical protein